MSRILAIICALLTAACATTLTDKAAKIQVHNQMSTLLSACKNLGPISASVEDRLLGVPKAINEAKVIAREQAADKGADTLVIVNIDTFSATAATVQGTAMRCYD